MVIDTERNLGFLVADITRLLRERFNGTAQSVGLTLAQARALAYLARHQGISQVALARLLEVQPITLLRQLDRLGESGLIERRPHPVDRRAQQLFLTPAAEALFDQLAEIGSRLTETAMAGLGKDDRETLFRLLGQIKQNLSQTSDPGQASNLRQAPSTDTPFPEDE
jgi:MarR family transcriptional regulator, transcriptional regulator for hemolysin